MFLHLSVILLTGGGCVVAPGGVACMVAQGACMVAPGGMCGCSGGCMVFSWGHAWFFLGGCAWFFPRGACIGYDEIRSMSGRYTSYWNAFLLSKRLQRLQNSVTMNTHLNPVKDLRILLILNETYLRFSGIQFCFVLF